MSTAQQRPCKTIGEIRNVSDSFIGKLDVGELLIGTPTVVEVTTSDLTIGNIAVNTKTLTINGAIVLPGQAVQFNVVGGVIGVEYIIKISVSTNATPAQTLFGKVLLLITDDN